MRETLLQFLNKILGDSSKSSGDNHKFYCPVCNHYKKKLEVDVVKKYWHCWVCDKGGKNLFSLLKWIGANDAAFKTLKSILPRSKKRVVKDQEEIFHTLPDEFIPLWESDVNNFYWKSAINYLKSRGVNGGDILRYGIGYCTSGAYENMIIIPSYNRNGLLNYFVTRSFLNSIIKFKNPPFVKNVIGFDSMINWEEPIVLVESAFDAIAVRHNAIPLFGKSISDILRTEIVCSGVDVIMCLDSDAVIDAMNHTKYFIGNGNKVLLSVLPDGHDPSSLGHHQVWDYINNASIVDKNSLLKFNIKDHLYGKGKTHLSYRRRTYSSFSKTR